MFKLINMISPLEQYETSSFGSLWPVFNSSKILEYIQYNEFSAYQTNFLNSTLTYKLDLLLSYFSSLNLFEISLFIMIFYSLSPMINGLKSSIGFYFYFLLYIIFVKNSSNQILYNFVYRLPWIRNNIFGMGQNEDKLHFWYEKHHDVNFDWKNQTEYNIDLPPLLKHTLEDREESLDSSWISAKSSYREDEEILAYMRSIDDRGYVSVDLLKRVVYKLIQDYKIRLDWALQTQQENLLEKTQVPLKELNVNKKIHDLLSDIENNIQIYWLSDEGCNYAVNFIERQLSFLAEWQNILNGIDLTTYEHQINGFSFDDYKKILISGEWHNIDKTNTFLNAEYEKFIDSLTYGIYFIHKDSPIYIANFVKPDLTIEEGDILVISAYFKTLFLNYVLTLIEHGEKYILNDTFPDGVNKLFYIIRYKDNIKAAKGHFRSKISLSDEIIAGKSHFIELIKQPNTMIDDLLILDVYFKAWYDLIKENRLIFKAEEINSLLYDKIKAAFEKEEVQFIIPHDIHNKLVLKASESLNNCPSLDENYVVFFNNEMFTSFINFLFRRVENAMSHFQLYSKFKPLTLSQADLDQITFINELSSNIDTNLYNTWINTLKRNNKYNEDKEVLALDTLLIMSNYYVTVIISFMFFLILIYFLSYNSLSNNINTLIPNRYQILSEGLFKGSINLFVSSLGKNLYNKEVLVIINTIFIFIIINNIQGMIPFTPTSTSHLINTLYLAMALFVTIIIFILIRNSLHSLFDLFMPKGCPVPLIPLLVPIEFISYFFRVISLSVRLFANMMAGHTLLKVIVGFSWSIINIQWGYIFNSVPLLVLMVITMLEIGVALIQAYIFATLGVIYFRDVFFGH